MEIIQKIFQKMKNLKLARRSIYAKCQIQNEFVTADKIKIETYASLSPNKLKKS